MFRMDEWMSRRVGDISGGMDRHPTQMDEWIGGMGEWYFG